MGRFPPAMRRWAIGLGLLLALVFLSGAHLVDAPSITDAFPSTHPYVETFRAYNRQFGGAERLLVMAVVKRGNVFTPDALRKIRRVHRAVERIPGVNRVVSISSQMQLACAPVATCWGFIPPRWCQEGAPPAHMLRKYVYRSTRERLWVSADETAALIEARFSDATPDFARVAAQMESITASMSDDQLSLHATGRPLLAGTILAQGF